MPFGKEGSEPDVKPVKDSRLKYEFQNSFKVQGFRVLGFAR